MRINKTTFPVKSQCSLTIPGSHIHKVTSVAVMLTQKMDHISSISLTLDFRHRRYIFQLTFPMV